ncbi:MAG: serine hydrolase [Bacteroidota bacterium]
MKQLLFCIMLLGAFSLNGQTKAKGSLPMNLAPVLESHLVQGMQLVIVSKDSLLFSANLGNRAGQDAPITDSTLFCIASITKSFTALGIMMLVEEGKLDLNERLRDVAPEVEFTNPWEIEFPVRVVHLLEHTTGWDKDQFHQLAYDRTGKTTLENLEAFPETRVCRYPPGQFFSYTNDGSSAAGYIIEKRSGLPYEQFIQERIFNPLGMRHSTFVSDDATAKEMLAISIGEQTGYRRLMDNPAAGIFTTAGDMAKYLQFYLNKGAVNGQQLVKASTIDRMLYAETTLSSNPAADHDYLEYGKGFYHYSKNGLPVYGHGGRTLGFSSNMLLFEANNQAFFLATNDPNYTKVEILSSYLFKEMTKGLTSEEPVQNNRLIDESWSGYYRPINSEVAFFHPIQRIINISQIKFDGKGLVLQKKLGRKPWELYEEKDGKAYFFSPSGIKWYLFKGPDLQGNEVLQLGDTSGNLESITAFQAWGNLLLVIFSILFLISIPIIALFRWFTTKINVQPFQANRSLQLAVLATGCLFIMTVHIRSIAQSLGGGGNQSTMSVMDQLLTLTPLSFSFFLFGCLFAVFSLLNSLFLVKQWSNTSFQLLKVYLILVTLVLLLSTYYLGMNGYIGMMTWRT